MSPDNDGITHINIYSKGRTELGRFLSNFTQFKFSCEDGKFNSIEGYWYWLNTGNDELRNLYGYEAKRKGKEAATFRKTMYKCDTEFKRKILSAIDIKLNSIKNKLVMNNLLFEHYYVYGNTVVDAGYKWILEHIEKRCKEFKDEMACTST